MTTVGRAFAFYVKYWNEMEALYGEEGTEALLKSVPKRERQEMKEQIQAVGERAGEQAAALLNECGEAICDHFEQTLACEMKRETRASIVKERWYVLYDLRGRKRRAWDWDVGVAIMCPPDKTTPAILLSLWARGGLAGERKLEKVLGSKVKYRGRDFGWSSGRIFYGEVPIDLDEWKNHKKLDAQGERLVTQTKEALKTIGRRDIRELFEL